nr:hypothetical protein GCM10020093_082200 [Planobispora longispora]
MNTDKGRHRRRWWQRGIPPCGRRRAGGPTRGSPRSRAADENGGGPSVDRPQYTWQDFELADERPRAQPNSPDTPDTGDGLRHCGPLERVLHRQWDARKGPPPRRSCGRWRAWRGCPTG